VGVAEAVNVGGATLPQARRLALEQLDVSRYVDVVPASGCSLLSSGGERSREPRLVIEPDTNQEIGGPERRDLAGLEIERMGVVKRGGKALYADSVTAYRLDQCLEIGGRRHHVGGTTGNPAAGPTGDLRPGGPERDRESEDLEERYDFFVKADFGIMQCTPFRTSTTWLTRQSPIIDVSEYAS